MSKTYIMSRIFSGLAVMLSLASCGFQPMYGDKAAQIDAPVAAALSQVEISIIPNHEGQSLRNQLIDRFYTQGYPDNPAYRLDIPLIQEIRTDMDITKSSESTRAQLRLKTTMSLTDRKTGQVVLTRDLFALASFNVLESEFATRVTEDKARENAITDLARQVELNLTLYLNHQP